MLDLEAIGRDAAIAGVETARRLRSAAVVVCRRTRLLALRQRAARAPFSSLRCCLHSHQSPAPFLVQINQIIQASMHCCAEHQNNPAACSPRERLQLVGGDALRRGRVGRRPARADGDQAPRRAAARAGRGGAGANVGLERAHGFKAGGRAG